MKKTLLALFAALTLSAISSAAPKTEKAVFAGGCFWCMEPPFEKTPGVIAVVSGYTGGQNANPTYRDVSAGGTGHAEAVEVEYDPAVVSYEKLLVVYWHNVDPFAVDRQFCDEGNQYRTAIFCAGERQQKSAEASKAEIAARFKRPVATQIVPASVFYPAEEYHQDYYKKNPVRYKFYRANCGRDQRLKEVWGGSAAR